MIAKSSDSADRFAIHLPPLEACEELNLDNGSVLISAAGFEKRTLALTKAINSGGENASAIIIRYEPGDARNNLASLVKALRAKKLSLDLKNDIVAFNRFTPDDFGNGLKRRLVQQGARSALLDISSMSKMALLLTLEVCRELNIVVSIFYAEAKSYGPARKAYKEARKGRQIHQPSIQVYSGIGEVVRSARLSSVAMQGEPLAAVMFMSFNELLTQALLNCVYPSRLFLINGCPPEHVWREEATAWIHEKLRAEWPDEDNPVDRSGLPVRSTSTLHYGETVATLLDLYWSLSTNYRMILAPTGSKMQTLGLFLARALHPDIHVEYPTPKGYLKLYTTGIGRKWLVHFGKLDSTIKEWRRQDKAKALGIESLISGDA